MKYMVVTNMVMTSMIKHGLENHDLDIIVTSMHIANMIFTSKLLTIMVLTNCSQFGIDFQSCYNKNLKILTGPMAIKAIMTKEWKKNHARISNF